MFQILHIFYINFRLTLFLMNYFSFLIICVALYIYISMYIITIRYNQQIQQVIHLYIVVLFVPANTTHVLSSKVGIQAGIQL